MTTVTSRPALIAGIARETLAEFLIAEYELTTETLLRNEESGERRAAFFLALAGAAGAVLAFAFDGDHPFFDRARVAPAVAVLGAVLLLFGWMTMLRLIERQITTDKLLFGLRDLRRLFISRADAAIAPNAFFQPYEKAMERSTDVVSLGRGGWLESVEVVNALLALTVAAAALRWWRPGSPWWPLSAAAGAAFMWWAQKQRVKNRMNDKKLKARRAADETQYLGLDR